MSFNKDYVLKSYTMKGALDLSIDPKRLFHNKFYNDIKNLNIRKILTPKGQCKPKRLFAGLGRLL
jgi:hypothetical protein